MTFELHVLFLSVFIISFLTILFSKNWKNHTIVLFCLLIYFIYLYLTPSYYAGINDFAKHDNEFGNYFLPGMWIYFFSLVFFLLGYLSIYLFIEKAQLVKSFVSDENKMIPGNGLDLLFYGILLLNLITLSMKGISLDSIINPPTEEVSGSEEATSGGLSYLIFFSDSLITVLIAGALYKVKNQKLIFWLGISFFIFLLMGFRYRIILTIVGLFLVHIFRNKIEFRKVFHYPIIFLLIAYLIIFITNNRKEFISLKFNEITFNLDKKEKSSIRYLNKNETPLIFAQTNNFSTDFSVLKSFEMGMAENDYGESMFLYVFIRLIPSALFENKIKPLAPQLSIIQKSFGSDAGLSAGSAVTNIFEYYVAFGEIGTFVCMFVMGAILANFSRKLNIHNLNSVLLYVIITAVCFQVITRGYTPQVVNHFAYMLIPYFIIKWVINGGVANNKNDGGQKILS